MAKAIEIKIKGIKCDACDWRDNDIKVEDYDSWLNKPCPNCGANLLTEEDLKTTKFLLSMVEIINDFAPKVSDNEPVVAASIKMNGTGAVDIEFKESAEE